jgi:hypothetical protein
MADEEGRPRPGSGIKLTWWQRSGLFISGVALVLTGAWAEISAGRDGAGTVAFVAAGALLGAVGIVGRLPNRISGKDYSVEFEAAVHERVEEELAEVVEDVPGDVRQEIAEADADELIGERSVASTAAARSLAFEQEVVGQLDVALKSRQVRPEILQGPDNTDEFDAIIKLDGRTVGVEVRARPLTKQRTVAWMRRMMDTPHPATDFAVLITPASMNLVKTGMEPWSKTYDGYPTEANVGRLVDRLLKEKTTTGDAST